jgi:hypothetical protein
LQTFGFSTSLALNLLAVAVQLLLQRGMCRQSGHSPALICLEPILRFRGRQLQLYSRANSIRSL